MGSGSAQKNEELVDETNSPIMEMNFIYGAEGGT
jgi:hypothetical protein